MTWGDPFKFPKNRGGFNGLGRAKAGMLDEVAVPFLRKRVPGAMAIKKGDFLYVETTDDAIDDPYLWTALEVNYMGTVFGVGLQTASLPNQLKKARFWSFQVRTGSPYPFVEEPFWYPTQLYVGGDYAVRLSRLNYRLFDGDYWSGNDTSRVFSYLTWVRPRAAVEQVVSMSPDNAEGKDISFIDMPFLDLGASGIFASGWDEASQGYAFGWTGRRVPTNDAEAAAPRVECYHGTTETRRVTLSVVEALAPVATRIFWPWTVARGRVFMLRLQPQNLTAANAVGVKVSADHGATWATRELPELQPFIFQYTDAFNVKRWNHPNLSDADRACFTPIGGGRIALVLLCSREPGRTWNNAEVTAAHPWLNSLTCWKFFVSDENGENFVNRPWPLDAHLGIRLSRTGGGSAGVDFSGLHPSVEFARTGLGGTPMTAGPGSFFMSVGQWMNDSPDYGPYNRRAVRFLWTTDYGDTWALSELAPEDAITPNPQPFNAFGQDSFAIAKVAVAKSITAMSKGLLYLAGVVPDLESEDGGWVENVYRTDAAFSAFKKVAINRIRDTTLVPPFGTFPPPGYMPAPIYVGNEQSPSRFKPLLRPGYPEFEKPAPTPP